MISFLHQEEDIASFVKAFVSTCFQIAEENGSDPAQALPLL